MNALIAACATLTLIALYFFVSVIRHGRHGRVLRAGGAAILAGLLAVLATGGALLLLSYAGYQRLVLEQPVAAIEFSQAGSEDFMARLMVDGKPDRLLPMKGNEWQLDARVLTWKPPATILGLEPVYQLERLSGRYSSVERELASPRTVHDLAGERALDLWSLARNYPSFTPGIDAYYGTATYLPMADGARFRISLSRDALVARPTNDAARRAVGDWGG